MRRWTIAVAVTLVILLVAAGGYQLMNARSFQLGGRLIDRVDTTERLVALTLDDGPTAATPEVLEILSAARVPATFYLNGRDLAERPAAGAAIARSGHEIGNHTYSHRRMVLVSPATVAAEVERTDEQIRRTGYRGPITFRPPYGKKLWTLPNYLSTHDRTTVMWDVEPDSANEPTAEQIVSATIDSVRPGSIILMHVMFDGRVASRAAIRALVDRLRSDGYRFVTVSELIAAQR
ncbi:polysaccharide deacetylase family protein [Mycobacterium sp. CPCC 205710]|uniref:Polysaccharide deacetylase family protein n=1 Tax=Mycobacterium deserti TaxID=2978347 RepID=A0ABT2M3Q7_9MYCO|nr:polysaccharide deacetylase family protein [Mycobacterium deserti]MCT7656899.1 polysaccharide deacetylase family protein [Mycobacterium deserti]